MYAWFHEEPKLVHRFLQATNDQVIRTVEERGGIAAARRRADEFAERAEEQLMALPVGRAREALRDCIVYVTERRS